jgi:hypothetical protein
MLSCVIAKEVDQSLESWCTTSPASSSSASISASDEAEGRGGGHACLCALRRDAGRIARIEGVVPDVQLGSRSKAPRGRPCYCYCGMRPTRDTVVFEHKGGRRLNI